MRPDLCIYHSPCADGFGAAWAVRKRFGDSIEYAPGVYGKPPPDVAGRRVMLVDFSYKRPVLEEMARVADAILILDHHVTARDDLAGFPEPPPAGEWLNATACGDIKGICALFDMERSGAGMAWDYFHEGEPRPKLIDHIEDRDLWRFAIPGTREIQANLFSFPYSFADWDGLMEKAESAGGRADMFVAGAAIDRKMMKDIGELLGIATRHMIIGGHDVPVVNLPYTMASEAAGKLAESATFAAAYFDRADCRVFSLRSRGDFDVSAIAKLYGGGGHKNAAGFQCELGWEGDDPAEQERATPRREVQSA